MDIEKKRETVLVFGFEVDVQYSVVDGEVKVDKALTTGIPPLLLEGYDVTSHVQEHLQGELDAEEDQMFADKEIEDDNELPF